ncbi:MAG: hypothetical protein PVJ52_03045, partial [Candidatus Woesebacteria bacterium]
MNTPDFFFEKTLWRKGFDLVGGVDEAGRGSFAGPVVAACVAFDTDYEVDKAEFKRRGIKVNDSKKLTRKQREIAN